MLFQLFTRVMTEYHTKLKGPHQIQSRKKLTNKPLNMCLSHLKSSMYRPLSMHGNSFNQAGPFWPLPFPPLFTQSGYCFLTMLCFRGNGWFCMLMKRFFSVVELARRVPYAPMKYQAGTATDAQRSHAKCVAQPLSALLDVWLVI